MIVDRSVNGGVHTMIGDGGGGRWTIIVERVNSSSHYA